MHRIDSAGATVDNKFTEGNPSTGVPATEVDAEWLNAIQEEVIACLAQASIAPVKGTNTQLRDSILAMIAAAGGGGGGGEANTGSNVGTGGGQVYKEKVGADLRFRRLLAGSGVTIVTGVDDVTISATGGAGDITGGTSVGTGRNVFKDKLGSTLRFRTLVAGTNVTITEGTNEITIAAAGGGATVSDASETVKGIVELATVVETAAGSDNTRAIHPAGAAAVFAKLSGATFSGAVAAPSFNTTSDRRLKDSPTPLLANQRELERIRLWSWVWNEKAGQLAGRHDTGVIADEVEQVFPTCVTTGEDGIKRVDYGKLAVHLVLARGV